MNERLSLVTGAANGIGQGVALRGGTGIALMVDHAFDNAVEAIGDGLAAEGMSIS